MSYTSGYTPPQEPGPSLSSSSKSSSEPSIREILNDRGKTHGDYITNAGISQQLKTAARSWDHWGKLAPYHQEAIDMIFHKIARAMAGDHNFKDHWSDIAGYAQLVADRCLDK